jgi:hypothetical protein
MPYTSGMAMKAEEKSGSGKALKVSLAIVMLALGTVGILYGTGVINLGPAPVQEPIKPDQKAAASEISDQDKKELDELNKRAVPSSVN